MFSVAGEEQVLRTFSRWTEAVSDFAPVFSQIADDFLELESRQFESEGKAGSGGWAALSPRYAAWKQKRYPGAKILERTGLMKLSLTTNINFGIREVSATQLVLGTKVPYAIYHQKGTRKMPARPPIELSEDDKRRWSKLVHQWLYEMAASVGGTGFSAEAELRQHIRTRGM
jgi:phage gpG-like protein